LTLTPLFLGYVFVRVIDQWHAIVRCPGVARLVRGGGDSPARVADQIIAELRSRETNGVIELSRRGLMLGDRVRVGGGPFRGQLGLYAGRAPHERVLILLALLGGERQITLPAGDVEAAPM